MDSDWSGLGLGGWMMNLKSGFGEMFEFRNFMDTYRFGNPIPVGFWGLWKMGEGFGLDGV
jgi:hypothetical protein